MNDASSTVYRSRRCAELGASKHWSISQLVAAVGFLQSKINHAIFIKAAPGHEARHAKTAICMVMKLKRSLYGLSQSPAIWHDTTDMVLLGIVFTPTCAVRCIYKHGSSGTFTILSAYVYGILILGMNKKMVHRLKKALEDRFARRTLAKLAPTLVW